MLNDSKYYVIRAMFKKNNLNTSFLEYIDNGKSIINNYNYSNLSKYPRIYLYGCGQFLFKIFNYIQEHTEIINIVDDNLCFLGKKIKDIDIINYDVFCDNVSDNDVILITSLVYSTKIKEKLKKINKNITAFDISEL
jgi:hypothetical protein